jgi:PAS domain S-box-containing protein
VSFRLKTILGIAAIEAILLAVLVVSGLRWLHDSNEEQLIQRGAATASLFAATAKDAVLATDLATLESLVQETLGIPGVVYVRVRNADSVVLAEAGDPEVLARSPVPGNDPSKATDGVFDTVAEIREAGAYFGRVEIGLTVESFRALLRNARTQGIGIALLEILLVAIFSLMLGTVLTRQLRHLQQASVRLAREGPGYQIPVKGKDELATAVRAFNEMSSRLARLHRERIRTEEELRLAAHAFQAQEAIFVTDADARILRVNDAFTRITGYEGHEAIGMTPKILKSGRQDAGFYRDMWARIREDGHWEGEIENRRKDGEIFPEWLSITAVRDGQGRITNYVAHFVDISERKRNEAALERARARAEQASEAKSRFLATMSHEIRTPLNAIINMNDLLLETGLDREQSTYAATASEAGRNLLSIVNSILDFSKIEAGRMEKRPELCDPEEIADGVVRLLAPRAFAKGIELTLFADPQTPRRVRTDPGLLRQILLNLIGNAVKFTETGGVRVRTRLEEKAAGGPFVRFDVIDTGLGIPEDRQSLLFDEFTQVDDSHTRRFGGTGLGLSISRALSRILGGEVGFESEPGRGSRFWLQLPASDMEPAADSAHGLRRLLQDRIVLIQSASPILAEETGLQLKAAGLNARVVDALPGAWGRPGDAGCAARIAVIREAPAVGGQEPPAHPLPRLIRLLRTGERDGGDPRNGDAAVSGRLPIAPRTLYGLLREVAGESPQTRKPPADPDVPSPAPEDVAARLPILLVEDSAPNRLVAKSILSKGGYSVEAVENGLQAVSAVAEKSYGLVLMDVAMPEMDGLEATRAIRTLPGEAAHVPIVAMTAGAFSEDRQRCLDAGMDDHLSKPIVRAELMRAVERWLKRRETPMG